MAVMEVIELGISGSVSAVSSSVIIISLIPRLPFSFSHFFLIFVLNAAFLDTHSNGHSCTYASVIHQFFSFSLCRCLTVKWYTKVRRPLTDIISSTTVH